MKCGCGGLIEDLHDRSKCLMCGRSSWKEFCTREATTADKAATGAPTGVRINGKNNIKARI